MCCMYVVVFAYGYVVHVCSCYAAGSVCACIVCLGVHAYVGVCMHMCMCVLCV